MGVYRKGGNEPPSFVLGLGRPSNKAVRSLMAFSCPCNSRMYPAVSSKSLSTPSDSPPGTILWSAMIFRSTSAFSSSTPVPPRLWTSFKTFFLRGVLPWVPGRLTRWRVAKGSEWVVVWPISWNFSWVFVSLVWNGVGGMESFETWSMDATREEREEKI